MKMGLLLPNKWQGRDWFILLPETSKNLDKTYEEMIFKTLFQDTLKQKTMILERQGTKEGTPCISPSYQVGRVSRLQCRRNPESRR